MSASGKASGSGSGSISGVSGSGVLVILGSSIFVRLPPLEPGLGLAGAFPGLGGFG